MKKLQKTSSAEIGKQVLLLRSGILKGSSPFLMANNSCLLFNWFDFPAFLRGFLFNCT